MVSKLLLICLLFPTLLSAKAGYYDPWGKDTHLLPKKKEKIPITPPKRNTIMGNLSERIISFHQNVLSTVDGPRSHFRPTSSLYMQHAIRRYGFLKGYIMGCDRLLRENSDEWVYRKVVVNGYEYKWDPTF
ncbi:MAG: putative membrane protein insertion efficiency factor [Chlamydiia bacterium]|nr:putative membrane protein insertion efficiency factor [Chlamydiia bacterium]